MVTAAVDTFGELNVIFNNAGMNRPRGFMEVDEANFEQIVRVNTWGVIVCTQEAARQMIAQGTGGKIVNTGSIASRQGFWDFVPYCVAKFGTLAVTQATARGLIEHGITVNAFAPGVVDTPMWVGLNEDIRAIHEQPADADPCASSPPERSSADRHHPTSWLHSSCTWPRRSPTTRDRCTWWTEDRSSSDMRRCRRSRRVQSATPRDTSPKTGRSSEGTTSRRHHRERPGRLDSLLSRRPRS